MAAEQQQNKGWLWNKLGYENLPTDVKGKSFYDLKAELPGGKELDLVSFAAPHALFCSRSTR